MLNLLCDAAQRHRWSMFVTRFAPSPTGFLHLGHAFSALCAFDAARTANGAFLLRIEDTDAGRCRRDYEAAIYQDLAWLGIEWQDPVRRQSDHMVDYQIALDKLISLGVLYRCFKTRKDILADLASAPHSASAPYRGQPLSPTEEAVKLNSGDAFAWRLSLVRCQIHLGERWRTLGFEADGVWTAVNTSLVGDAVIARKEFAASYHLASVHDDALQGVTHVIRGRDLINAPHLHVILQTLLDLPTPIYCHHDLILDKNGQRLSKRNQSATLASLRATGMTPKNVRAQIGLET